MFFLHPSTLSFYKGSFIIFILISFSYTLYLRYHLVPILRDFIIIFYMEYNLISNLIYFRLSLYTPNCKFHWNWLKNLNRWINKVKVK